MIIPIIKRKDDDRHQALFLRVKHFIHAFIDKDKIKPIDTVCPWCGSADTKFVGECGECLDCGTKFSKNFYEPVDEIIIGDPTSSKIKIV